VTAILKLFGLVPASVWLGLGAALAVIAGAWSIDHHGYNRGAAEIQLLRDQEKVAYAAALEREKARQAQVVEKVRVEYVDRVKVIKEKGDEIVKAVPYYVRGSCALPGGWRVLHDAAASGSFPEDPDGAVAAAEPVEGVAAAETVAANYATCRADQARLAALQQLLTGLSQ
jgi:hypothetical protein